MQNKSLIPTPLNPAHKSRRAIEIVKPSAPSRWRFLAIMWFVMVTMLRSIVARLIPPWRRAYYTPLQNARRLRAFMEEMGGLWVKAGQIVALRRDLFEEEFCAELTRLQDRARGFPGSYARQIIEEDLGVAVEELFEDFDEKPLAAASIGQAHCARLRGMEVDVVIKIQRPNIAASFAHDLRQLYIMVWLLERVGVARQFRWMDMFWEIEHAILEELDYRQEAASLRRMRKQLRSQKIYVPKVFLEYCSDRVLVMEMVRGVYMSEYIQVAATDPERAQAWLKENKISARRAGERMLFSHYRQLIEDNFYHCDLHPGNILLMRNSRITLIDFGSVGSSDRSQLTNLLNILIAVANRDYHKVADLFLLLSPELPNKDLSEAKEKIVRFYREFEPLTRIKSLPYHQKSVGRVAGEIVKALGEAGVGASWDMLRSNRAELTLDASLMFLLPDIDYPKTLRRYIRQMRERQRKQLQRTRPIREQLAKVAEQVDLPTKLAENVYYEGEYLRKRARKYEGYLSKAAQLGEYLFMLLSRGFALAGVAALAVMLHQRYGILWRLRNTWFLQNLDRLPRIDVLVWLLIIGGMLYLSSEITAIRNVLSQPEPAKAGGDRR
jgi:ubiquinone biosynthesis protein